MVKHICTTPWTFALQRCFVEDFLGYPTLHTLPGETISSLEIYAWHKAQSLALYKSFLLH